jgi:transketolase
VCHYAGLIPAGPGKSHQSLRDISLFGALPNCVILEPCNGMETKRALEWCIDEAKHNCMMRLVISPSPRTITLPENYNFSFGKGTVIKEGKDAVLFSYGPVMLNEALAAAEMLAEQDFSLKVANLPWLNRIDDKWLAETIGDCQTIFSLDNHSEYGGLGDHLLNALMRSDNLRDKKLIKFAVDEHPACGTPQEALSYHKLDGASIVGRILNVMSDMQLP